MSLNRFHNTVNKKMTDHKNIYRSIFLLFGSVKKEC